MFEVPKNLETVLTILQNLKDGLIADIETEGKVHTRGQVLGITYALAPSHRSSLGTNTPPTPTLHQSFDTITATQRKDVIMHISLNIKKEDIEVQTLPDEKRSSFSEFSGLWKDRDIDIKTIRESAWKK